MYGKHRCILQSAPRQQIVVAGKRTPESQGGSYHPLGFWEFDGKQYVAHLRSFEQWYRMVSRNDLIVRFYAATKKELRAIVLAYHQAGENR
jgi:hypothetical protein